MQNSEAVQAWIQGKMATFRILGLVSKNEIRSREFSFSSRSLRVKIINLDLVSMPEIGGNFFSVSSRSLRVSVRNSRSRLDERDWIGETLILISRLKKRLSLTTDWPDPSGEESLGVELDIGGGCKVEHLSTSFQGSFFQRQVKIASNPFPGSFYCTTCLVGTVGRLFSSTPTIGLILLRPKNQGGEIMGILLSKRVEKSKFC